MVLTWILGALALLSFALNLWQFVVARRFPLHQRVADKSFAPAVTLLKPLKGRDAETAACLRSWLGQNYSGPVQILFGVASPDDPVCEIVRALLAEMPKADARLVHCGEALGPNAKVSTLIQLERLARHDTIIVSDADVRVPPDLLANVVAPLREETVGLVHCFYRLAHPTTLAMHWEAICINADFWSQVLQSRSLKPIDFALGAVMAVRRTALTRIGGFQSLVEFLADDYQLGRCIAGQGWRIELCPVVAECWEVPVTLADVWRHQLRWARTIRVCQPAPYFFSILGNATFWPLLFFLSGGTGRLYWVLLALTFCVLARLLTASLLHAQLTRTLTHLKHLWLVPVKDLLGAAIWALAFIGNTIDWRGQKFRVLSGGKLVQL